MVILPYKNSIALKKKLNLKNINAIPKLSKICLNRGTGVISNPLLNSNIEELSLLSGQQPKVMKAKQSISNFKIRKGMNIGLKITLRKKKMHSFLIKFLYLVLPKIRNFQGLDILNIDKNGNLNIGIPDQLLFPEVDYIFFEKNKKQGINISFITTTLNKYQSFLLLKELKFPFSTYDN